MVVRQGGTQGKKIANPINENENHTIWLLKEVHHEKLNQSLSEIIVIQVVLCIIIVPGLMPPPPSLQPAYGPVAARILDSCAIAINARVHTVTQHSSTRLIDWSRHM